MITELIFMTFLAVSDIILALIPDAKISLPVNIANGLNVITKNVGYILPVPGLVAIFGVYMSWNLFKLGYFGVIRIKSFIPTMGN